MGNDKLLFLHVPKTGGTWAMEAMIAAGVDIEPEKPPKAQHLPLGECEVRGRFTFAFVREPLSWYGSQYNFRRARRYDDGFPGDPYLDLPFADYIEGVIRDQPGFLSRHYASFVGPRQHPIDFIGRYENLADDLVMALTLAGQSFDEDALRAFPPINGSGPPPECPEGLRERLRESENVAYERWYSPVPA